MIVTEQGNSGSKSYGLGTGWLSLQRTPRCRWRRFPFQHCFAPLPRRNTRLPLSPHCNPSAVPKMDSLGDFHRSQTVSYPLLQMGFQGNHSASPARDLEHQLPYPPSPRKAGYSAHSVHGLKPGSTAMQVSIHLPRTPVALPPGEYADAQQQVSTTAGSGPPCHWRAPYERRHAKTRLPSSTHPKLGVRSRHQRFHSCAL